MNIEWLAAWPQVGDAPEYLWHGESCAYDGQCFNTLRPIISMLWFSLPHRLGLPSTAILILHALLLLCSIALSTRLMIRLAGKSEQFFRLQQLFAGIVSAGIHTAFLWPTFFYSLTDTPAALLTLCAIFLLLLLQSSSTKFLGLGYFFTGLLFGCAEGLRIFYLYPLLAFLVLYLTISALQKIEWRRLYLLSALLPVLLQNYATFLYSGEITHMPASPAMRFWSKMHSDSIYTGYDTLIPAEGYPWFISPCAVQQGLRTSWNQHDWQQLSCLIAGRMHFLLGSYSQQTYFERNDITLGDIALTGNLSDLGTANWENPYSSGGIIFQATAVAGDNIWHIDSQTNLPSKPITLALTTQSDETSTQLIMRIQKLDGQILAEKTIPMTLKPVRHFLHADIPVAGAYVITVGADKTHPAPFIFQLGDHRLTPSSAEEDYPVDPNKVRYWSLIILSVQIIIILLFVVTALKKSKNQPECLAIAALPLLIIAQSSMVIPEQRFIIVSEICFWLAAVTVFMRYVLQHYPQRRHADAKPEAGEPFSIVADNSIILYK